jgi:virginiamycin A acetyltransferase
MTFVRLPQNVPMRAGVKTIANMLSRTLLCPVGLLVNIADRALRTDEVFLFSAHICALFPGKPGEYLRRAFYWWTLRKCGKDLVVGFGSFFTGRNVILGDAVWIGQYSIIGNSRIESGVLISDNVSVLTGSRHHIRNAAGQLVVAPPHTPVTIGRNTWIGAGAIVMASVGSSTNVGAGAVVVKSLPDSATAVGIPATVVRHR